MCYFKASKRSKNLTTTTITTQGLVLRTVPYKQNGRVITLFTEKLGTIGCMVYGITPKNTRLNTQTSPLALASYTLTQKKGSLFTLKEVCDPLIIPELRYRLPLLKTAATFGEAISRSQAEFNPAPLLFQLTKAYFTYLAKAKNPLTLAQSYKLKTMKHDGLCNFQLRCCKCRKNQMSHYYEGDSYCDPCHRRMFTTDSIQFSQEEWHQLYLLTYSRSLAQIDQFEMTPTLEEKIDLIYNQAYQLTH